MSERDELRARAEALGIEVDNRWNVATLRKRIADAEASASERTAVPAPADGTWSEAIEGDGTGEALPPVPEVDAEDDGWPQQIAPQAWLDQQGRRYTDLGEAQAGAEECRRR